MHSDYPVEPPADFLSRQALIPSLTEESVLNSVAPLDIPPVSEKTAPLRSTILDYFSLAKPEITFLVTISSVAGFILGTVGEVQTATLIALIVGVALSSAGGAALNHYIERDKDKEMKRTDNRPLPTGRVKPLNALILANVLSIAGIAILLIFCNILTSLLAGLTIVLYIFLYTPLKQHTKYNTLVGTIPGALPALGGWTAATGSVGLGGLIIFTILLIWQLPHFLALAWMYRKDYDRAGFKMLPVVEPEGQSTANQMLISAILLLVTSLLPSVLGLTGMIYFFGVLITGSWLVAACVVFYRTMSNLAARRVLKVSVIHIPVLVVLLIVDRVFF